MQTALDKTDSHGNWEPVDVKQKEIPKAWMPFAKDMASYGVLVGFPR